MLNGGNARLPNTQSNANANPAPPRSELRVEQPNFSPQPPNHFTTHEEVENYLESTPDFRDFNWDTLQDEPPVPSSPPAPRRLFALDLQLSSPLPSGRTATNGTLGSFASQVNSSNATMPPKKRGRPSNSTAEPANKRTRVSASEEKKENDPNAYDLFGIKKDGKKYEEVDLVDVEGDEDYQATMKKREADKKAQALKDAASKPQKLATTQCIVCMDQMEGLTVTHCGKSSLRRRLTKPGTTY